MSELFAQRLGVSASAADAVLHRYDGDEKTALAALVQLVNTDLAAAGTIVVDEERWLAARDSTNRELDAIYETVRLTKSKLGEDVIEDDAVWKLLRAKGWNTDAVAAASSGGPLLDSALFWKEEVEG